MAAENATQQDDTPRYSCLYFGYGSNLSARTMKQRCPGSLYICLARLPDWKWTINETGFANIIPSPGDEVYGSLCFLPKRDEIGLDESEGVPWFYEKVRLKVYRISVGGGDWGTAGAEEEVEVITYVDLKRTGEGKIERDYIVWIRKAIDDGLKCGMPEAYADKYLRPVLPALEPFKELPSETIMMRTTRLDAGMNLVPTEYASLTRG